MTAALRVVAVVVSSLTLNINIIPIDIFSTKLNYRAETTVFIIAKHNILRSWKGQRALFFCI
jgi:transposase